MAGGGRQKRAAKEFTIEGANATLPLVRAIVRDVTEKWRELGRLRAELADAEVHGISLERKAAIREEVEGIEADLRACVGEIADLGAAIKDFDAGLVDFPMRWRGRTVLLCWRAGEPEVEHWHEEDAGFAGRRPIADLKESGAV